MGATTNGYIPLKVDINEAAKFLESLEYIKDIEIKEERIKFIHKADMELYDEPRELIFYNAEMDESRKEYFESIEIPIDNFNETYTGMYLGSWGHSIEIIYDILVHFGGGYLMPNDNNEYWIYVNEYYDRNKILLLDTAYD